MDRIQLRRDTSARWAEINPILLEGEVGYEIDTKLRKIGDGTSRWNDLEYLKAEGISQEAGNSQNITMSQDAITRELSKLGQEVKENQNQIENTILNSIALMNIVQGQDFTDGAYVSVDDGRLYPVEDYSCSDFIVCNHQKFGVLSVGEILVAFFDDQKGFISGVTSSTVRPFTVPSNCKFIRLSIKTSDVQSSSVFPYAEGDIHLNERINLSVNPYIRNLYERFGFVVRDINSLVLVSSVRGVSSEDIVENKYIDPSSGSIIILDGYTTSSFIDIDDDADYELYGFEGAYGCWYDYNKRRISGIQKDVVVKGYVIHSPENAAFLRISTKSSAFISAFIVKTDLSLSAKINIDKHPGIERLKVQNLLLEDKQLTSSLELAKFELLSDTYIDPSNGNTGAVSGYTAIKDFVQIKENAKYYFYGFSNVYGSFYDSNKKFLEGFHRNGGLGQFVAIAPHGAAFIRVSGLTSKFGDCFISESNFKLSPNVRVGNENLSGLNVVETITVSVKPNGGGDFVKLSDAFAAITDSSYAKRYIVDFYGDGTEYNTLEDKPYIEGEIGLTIPPFTKLRGVGGKEKNILVRRLNIADSKDSLLNLHMTSELEGFTLISENTRYVVHDDFFVSKELDHIDYVRVVRDVEVKGKNLSRIMVWGAGNRSGANWLFENCIFKSETSMAYSCHNNTNFTNTTKQKFVNCRFITPPQYESCIRFGTLSNNANAIYNIVEFYGCQLKEVRLTEENAATLGTGILFKVLGFGNDLKNGSDKLVIVNTNGVDYSTHFDLV